MQDLSDMYELMHGPGEVMKGSTMSNEEAMAYFQRLRTYQPHCFVRDWIWIDLTLTDAQRRVLEETRRQPVILYAHRVIYDSSRRFDVGDFVRTSPLLAFEDGWQFSTVNSIYVLLGDGLRKRASLETVGRIF
ncbi:DUF6957 family protein [Cycloclasticus pugetii]|uniref:DUF6957 family protein n=1 Tax=Cycloclasticus pugetii TaxID=34068 RepID=UPI003A91A85C